MCMFSKQYFCSIGISVFYSVKHASMRGNGQFLIFALKFFLGITWREKFYG